MQTRSVAWYEAKIVFGLSALLPLLVLPLHACIVSLLADPQHGIPSEEWLQKSYEVLLPLVVGLAAAHLMMVERDERFDELRASYPEHPLRLPLLRTGGALALSALALGLNALGLRLGYGPFLPREVMLPSIAPALYMLGLALLVGNVTGSYWAAANAVLGSWLFDVITRGRYTSVMFLFESAWPRGQIPLRWNRAILVGLGLVLMLLNIYVSVRRQYPRQHHGG
jgi:hypothetical protein